MAMHPPSRSLRRLGLMTVAMLAAAEAAVWVLHPRTGPAPAPVAEHHYFTAAQISRGREYSGGSLWIFAGSLAVEFAVLGALASGRPRIAGRALDGLGRRPLAGAAAAGAGLSLVLTIAGIPLGLVAHDRAVDFGLSTQDIGSWFADLAKSGAIGALLGAAGGALVIALVRRFRSRWWIGGTVAVGVIGVVMTWLAPVVIAPIFNRFEPLPAHSAARKEVLELGRRAGVDIGSVLRVDASRRVTSLNAYVDGIGQTKRVVLYDNLIHGAGRKELSSVVAHELGHVKHDDILRGLAFLALVAPLGVLFVDAVARTLIQRGAFDPATPRAVPAYALAVALASLLIGIVGNQLSRDVEAGADSFALQLTHDPRAFISLQKRLTTSNLGDPDPPALIHWLLGTHPTAVERIGAALALERSGSG